MRLLISILISLCLSLNAAYALGTDVCDALGHDLNKGVAADLSGHGNHFGHHSHDHEHEHAPVSGDSSSPAEPGTQAAHVDHCHPHPCFSSVLPGEMLLPSQPESQVMAIRPNDRIDSLPPSRLERPPRATLA